MIKLKTWFYAPIARGWALLAFLILTIGIAFAVNSVYQNSIADKKEILAARAAIVQSGRSVTVVGCNRDFKTITALRTVLQASQEVQRASFERGEITRQRFEEASTFNKEQILNLILPDCREAITAVTSNPDATVGIPEPLHP
jgi:hypothetical protein